MAIKSKLVIVESPAKAKTIKRFLGKDYKVIASQGHVRDLPKSQVGIDVNNNFDMKYITIRGKGDILSQIRKEAKNASKIYLATDPDREGEAISWHIAHILNIDPNSKCRIEFNEITSEAVKNSIKNARKIDENRVDAQQARRALDRLVGYGISPILWAKVKKGLSAGRVQSVATRMVIEREMEIEAFIPEEYWDITVDFNLKSDKSIKIQSKLLSIDGEKPAINNKQQAELLASKVENSNFNVASIKKTNSKSSPKPPFTTSTLQQDAVNKLRLSTAKTMQVVQQLYEGISIGKKGTIGLVTYIRTDSVRVSTEALNAVRSYIASNIGKEYLPDNARHFQGKKNAQDAHEAIRPTYIDISPSSIKQYLSNDQYKLYSLIYNRFVASQMNDSQYETTSINIEGNGIKLAASVKTLIFDGYRKIYIDEDNKEKQEKMFSKSIKKGSVLLVENVNQNQHFTEAKPHFTEASLVKELEEKGIGRPSTYAPTISTIVSRSYVSREQRTLYANDLGIIVTQIMKEYFKDIVNYDFTANMEDELDRVELGELEWKNVLRDFYPTFNKDLEKAKQEIEKIEIKDDVSDVICDKCGRLMVYKLAKYGKFLACPGFPECKNTKSLVDYIGVNCPKCNAQLVKKRSKSGRTLYGCEKYPECDFVSWQKPSNIKCELCNSYMIEKQSKKGETTYICSNEKCRNKFINKKDNKHEQ